MNGHATPPMDTGAPEVWVLLGHKAGDNNQVIALAESLGVPFAEKHMRYRPTELWSNLLLGPNLLGISRVSAQQLRPPWPKLVISAGRRNEPVARWIRQQAGSAVRLVHIGRPWARPERYDLIISTPQYCLDRYPNVMIFELPLHRIAEDRLEAAALAWSDRLAHLPAPRIAVLVGGESGGFHLDWAKAARLGREADRLARSVGGSLMISTSARTPRHAARELTAELRSPFFLFDWHAGTEDNPYLAFLAMADRFIVTGESMSMLTEACSTRRPVYIFDMSDGTGPSGAPLPGDLFGRVANSLRYRAITHRLAQRLAPVRMRRDITRLHRALIGSRRATWLGKEFPEAPPPPLPDATGATDRVRELLESRRP